MTEPFEKCYTVSELAKIVHISRTTLTVWFRDEPGVIRYGSNQRLRMGKRTHISLRIPESVARRVLARHTNGPRSGSLGKVG